jgi:4-amino-4-deoxy-L-arabinose transferase-like glycosyltransferase
MMALLLVSLAIRLAWGLSRPAELGAELPDQREYLMTAKNLLAGEGLQFFDRRFNSDVYAFRSPGYPTFVAMCGASPRIVRAAQAVIDTSTVLAIYLLARRWLDRRASLVAAAFVGFNPFLIFFAGLILSETLFTAALAWGYAMVARKQLVGLVPLAIAVSVRPATMLLPPIVCAIAAWPSRRAVMGWFQLGIAASFAVLFPWALRNHQTLGAWVWTTTNTGQTAWDGFRPGATGASDLATAPAVPEIKGLSEVDRDRVLGQLGRHYMLENIPRSVGLAVKKIARTWSPVPLSDEYASARNTIIGLCYALPLFVLTLVGLFRRNLPGPAKALCLLPAVYFTATVAISVGSLRYRIPAEPPMAVIAASVFVRRSTHGA